MDSESAMRTTLRQFELESTICDLERDMLFKHGKLPCSNFISVVKIDGVPILPPVLTKTRREEMRRYRQLAVLSETERRSLARHKILDKIQSSLNEIDVQHSKSPTNDFCTNDCRHVESALVKKDQSVQLSNQLVQGSLPLTGVDGSGRIQHEKAIKVTTFSAQNSAIAGLCCCEAVEQKYNRDKSSDSGLFGNSILDSLSTMRSSDFSDGLVSSGYTSEVAHTKTWFERGITFSDLKENCFDISGASLSAASSGDIRSSVMSASSGEDEMNRTVIGADEIMRSDESQHTVESEVGGRQSPAQLATLTGESLQVSEQSECYCQDAQPANIETQSSLQPVNGVTASSRTLLLDQTDLLSTSEDDSMLYNISNSAEDSKCGSGDSTSLVERSEPKEQLPKVQVGHFKAMAMQNEIGHERNDRFGHEVPNDFAYEYGECVAFADKILSDSIIRKINSSQCANRAEPSTNPLRYTGPCNNFVVHASESDNRVSKVSPDSVSNKQMSTPVSCLAATHTNSPKNTKISTVIESNISRDQSLFNQRSEQVVNSINFEKNCSELPGVVDHGYSLTSSMEDLRLRPSAKKSLPRSSKLDLPVAMSCPETLEHEQPTNIVIDPPAEFLDHSLVADEGLKSQFDDEQTEGMEIQCSNLLERQGKDDQIWRYLNSLDNEQAYVEECFDADSERPNRDIAVDQSFDLSEDCISGVTASGHLVCEFDKSPVANETAVNRSRVLTEDSLLELELEQYEQMKKRLLDEHRHSLQRLMAQQEHEMVQLLNRLSQCGSGLHVSEVMSSRPHLKLQGDKVSMTTHEDFTSANCDGPLAHDVLANLTDRCLSTPLPSCFDSMGSMKATSRAGVYYSEYPNTSPVPSCSTSTTDESESKFAYKSPAVLRKHRRQLARDVLPVSSTHQSPVFEASLGQTSEANTSYKSASSHIIFTQSRNPVPSRTEHQSQRRYVDPYEETIPADVQSWCEKLSAAVKGYLTRRLMKTDKVLSLIKTIWDTAEFALQFDRESPIKKGVCSVQDHFLRERILAQLESAVYDFHEILFILPFKERMHIIAVDRQGKRDRNRRSKDSSAEKPRRISAATMKAIERKKKAQEEKQDEPKRSQPKIETLPQTDISKKTFSRGSEAKQESNERVASRQQRSNHRAQPSPRKLLKRGINRSRASGNLARVNRISSPVKPQVVAAQQQKPSPVAVKAVPDIVIKTRKIARSTNSHIVRSVAAPSKPQPSLGLATNSSTGIVNVTRTIPKLKLVLDRYYAPTRVTQSITSSTVSSKTG